MAAEQGVSKNTVKRSAAYAEAVDRLDPAEKVVVLSGESGLSKQQVIDGERPKICPACRHRAEVGKPLIDKCEDCKELRKKPAPSPEPTLDEVLLQDEDIPDLTPEDVMNEKSSAIEKFCRKLQKIVDEELPEDEWLDYMDRRKSAIKVFQSFLATLRTVFEPASTKGDG